MTTDQKSQHEADEERDDLFEESLFEAGDGSYKPRPQLSQPAVNMRSLKWLMNALDAGLIDLNPDYQREVVWTADRMTGLLNSLMENYYIPPIILNRKSNDAETNPIHPHTLVCVDGKQRLSSVQAFIQGIIPCQDHRGDKWWYCDSSASGKRKVLPEATRSQFMQKDFVSFEFEDLSPEQEEDLFARVQMGVQLTAAEKMRASRGPWQELARMFVDDFPVIFSLLKDRTRAKEFQLALSCFSQILEVQHPTPANGIPMLKTNYTALPKLIKNREALDDGARSSLASVFTTFSELVELDPNTFTNGDKRLKGVQTFAPIEMVIVAVLISRWSDSRNNRLLLGDIMALREDLRENFVDLRMNIPIWKHAWSYIDDLEGIRGHVGTTINRSVRPASRTASPAAVQMPIIPLVPVANKERPAARTKPTTIAPGCRPTTTTTFLPNPAPAPLASIKPEEASFSFIRPPSRKRRRVQSPSRERIQLSSRSKPVANRQPSAGSSTADPMVLDDSPARGRLPLSSLALSMPPSAPFSPQEGIIGSKSLAMQAAMAARESSGRPIPPSAVTAPKTQKARRSQAPTVLGAGASIPSNGHLLSGLTSEQARQDRISALNSGFRGPQATMPSLDAPKGAASIVNPTPAHARSQFKELPNATNIPLPAQQSERPRTLPRRQKSAVPRPQMDSTVDLTEDDVEQERQNLLTQFSAPKKQKAPMVNHTNQGTSTTIEHIAVEHLGTNPYKKSLNPSKPASRAAPFSQT